MSAPTSIDAYLDQLAAELAASPRRLRRILAESEDHLRSAVAAKVAAGSDPVVAEAEAVAAFGTAREVARGFRREDVAELLRLVEPAFVSLLGVAAVGLLAIGLSGLVALAMGATLGHSFVAGDATDITYTQARCAGFFEYVPDAKDCEAAATEHHFGEVVDYRVAAGVLGLLALGAWYAATRLRRTPALSPAFAPTVGAALFGVAAAALLMQGLNGALGAGQAGANLSGGLVATVAFAGFAWRLLPALRRTAVA